MSDENSNAESENLCWLNSKIGTNFLRLSALKDGQALKELLENILGFEKSSNNANDTWNEIELFVFLENIPVNLHMLQSGETAEIDKFLTEIRKMEFPSLPPATTSIHLVKKIDTVQNVGSDKGQYKIMLTILQTANQIQNTHDKCEALVVKEVKSKLRTFLVKCPNSSCKIYTKTFFRQYKRLYNTFKEYKTYISTGGHFGDCFFSVFQQMHHLCTLANAISSLQYKKVLKLSSGAEKGTNLSIETYLKILDKFACIFGETDHIKNMSIHVQHPLKDVFYSMKVHHRDALDYFHNVVSAMSLRRKRQNASLLWYKFTEAKVVADSIKDTVDFNYET